MTIIRGPTIAVANRHDAADGGRGTRTLSTLRPWGCVTVRGREVVIEVQHEDALELVDGALIGALLHAGVAAEKEGPWLVAAVAPPIWWGRVRVAERGAEFLRRHVESARQAAVDVLREAGCALPRR